MNFERYTIIENVVNSPIYQCYYFKSIEDLEDIIYYKIDELDKKEYHIFDNMKNIRISTYDLTKYKNNYNINLNTLLYSLIMYSIINDKQKNIL